MVYESEVIALRQRVAKLERTIDFLLDQLKLTYVDKDDTSGVDPDIVALVHQGKKIDAIKLYRERNNVGLAEAKQVIDRLEGI